MITTDAVVWAYRLILGREPESTVAITSRIWHNDLESLRTEFLHSEEYIRNSPITSVGRHLEVDVDPVKIDCTPAQQQQMLDRIATNWRKYGEQDPYWSVLTAEQFRRANIGDNLDAFYASGESDVDQLFALLRRNAIDPGSLEHVLEFGCGVGRVTLALARRFAHVTGTDISWGHLQLARDRARQTGAANVTFTALDDLESIGSLPVCDLVFSRIVLQHNPPPVIAAVLKSLFGRIMTGGYAVFQVPTYIQNFQFDPETYLSSNQPQMEMNALPQRHIFAIAAQAGFVPVEVRENLDTGDHRMVSQIFLFQRV